MKLGTVLERNHNKAVTAPIREMPGVGLAEAAPRRIDRRSPKQALRDKKCENFQISALQYAASRPCRVPRWADPAYAGRLLSRCTSLAQVSKPSQATSKENGQKRAMSSPARLATARQSGHPPAIAEQRFRRLHIPAAAAV
jgi:hypothetical protein